MARSPKGESSRGPVVRKARTPWNAFELVESLQDAAHEIDAVHSLHFTYDEEGPPTLASDRRVTSLDVKTAQLALKTLIGIFGHTGEDSSIVRGRMRRMAAAMFPRSNDEQIVEALALLEAALKEPPGPEKIVWKALVWRLAGVDRRFQQWALPKKADQLLTLFEQFDVKAKGKKGKRSAERILAVLATDCGAFGWRGGTEFAYDAIRAAVKRRTTGLK